MGYVRPGYDADLVVWDRHPLRIGATPLEVYIDGRSTVRAPDSLWEKSLEPSYEGDSPHPRLPGNNSLEGCNHGQADFVIRGIKKSFVDGSRRLGDGISGNNLTAVIRNGEVVCIGETTCVDLLKKAESDNVPVIDVEDGYMLPVRLKRPIPRGLTYSQLPSRD
jgi:Imidazolonepropionase and related amidohydrolases